MEIAHTLEQFRSALFTGSPEIKDPHPTQEEYIEHYESQISRDPAQERKLLKELSAELLPIYRTQLEQMAKIEQMMEGAGGGISFTEEEVMEELYDEIVNMETEEEWQQFKKRLLALYEKEKLGS